MYSTHNERKSDVHEKCIRTLKNKFYKYMTSLSKIGYIDKLADTVDEYNNTYHTTIKMNVVDVMSSTCIDIHKENDKEDSKFEIDDHVRILIKKTFLQKVTLQIGLRTFL